MNKIRSIHIKIMLSTSLALIIGFGILIIYATITLRNQGFETAKAEMVGHAKMEAARIGAEIDIALDAGRTVAQSLAIIPANKNEELLSRETVNRILATLVENNPSFLGTYTGWEPDTFDGKDSQFANTTGHDSTGRFIPYWNRGANNNIVVEALAGYEDTTKDQLGNRAGDYYLIPKESKKEAIIDPYIYAVQGKDTLITSLVAPIVHQNKFYGIAGVDIALDFLQHIADEVDIFNHTGKLTLLSYKGIIAGISGKPDMVGKHLSAFIKDEKRLAQTLNDITNGKEEILLEGGRLSVMVPITIGQTGTNWAVVIEVPESEIMKASNAHMIRQIIIGVIIIILGLGAIWWISRSIALPLRRTSDLLVQIASEGDFSKRVEVKQVDETGQIGNAINTLMTSLQSIISNMNLVMTSVAEGDLTKRVTGEQKGDLQKLKSATNRSIEMLSDTISQVVENSVQVNTSANELASSAQSLASGTSEQAASLEEVSSSMNDIESQAKASNENANQAQKISKETQEIVQRGNNQMGTMVSSMKTVNETSSDVSKIIKAIDEIAFQTNLLALNAAVEAARAGKYGKGFAVVAEEVRNLAARSAEAAKNTTALIEKSMKEVEKGVDNAGKTAEILNEVNESVKKAASAVVEIAASSKEQTLGIDEINKGLTQVNTVVQQNSSISEETASASEELSAHATMMQQLMKQFKVSKSESSQSPRLNLDVEKKKIPAAVNNMRQQRGRPSPTMITLDDDSFGKY
ncbi:HAMP domain-containing protein [bacterium]|nr:HAMP domain-containing protein [bacterium]